MSPQWEESVWVFCRGCTRAVQMDPAFVKGKQHRMRCIRCGSRGPDVRRVHNVVEGDRSNVLFFPTRPK